MTKPTMTYNEAISRLVELDVTKWGEGERAAARRLRQSQNPTIGLALNALAHHDIDHIDEALATDAKRLMTAEDRRVLKRGG